ncbi:MAG: tetratricopeptide repeat protein, partial [Moorea sp. SIO4A1]|uniref:tetratricopeptide repeat protein n=1 Tax=Moorena sp. SIO4A1 TaxID=2607835 RepID=UPI00144DF73F
LLALVANTTGMTTLSYMGCFFIWAICGFITGWLKYGGLTSFQHFTLRLLLWMDRLSPWNYARFLDYATERIFLYKVGGGYTFIHRLPMDYFASLEADNFSKETGLFARWRLRYYLLPSFLLLVGLLLSILKLIPFAFEDSYLRNLHSNMNKGRYPKVIVYSEKLLKLNNKNARALIYRGIAQKELGNYQQAISDFDYAILLSRIPRELELYAVANRGLSHLWLRNYKQALQDFENALKKSKKNSIFQAEQLTNRAFLYNELGNYEQALSDSNKAIEIIQIRESLLSAYALLNRGRANAGLGNEKDALSDYNKIIELSNNIKTSQNTSISELRAFTFNYRAYTHARLGNYEEAIEDCKKSISLGNKFNSAKKPQIALAYKSCGFVFALKKDYYEAIKNYDKAIILDPKLGEAFEYRGLAHSKLGNPKLALQDLRRAIQLYKEQGKNSDKQRVINTINNLQ